MVHRTSSILRHSQETLEEVKYNEVYRAYDDTGQNGFKVDRNEVARTIGVSHLPSYILFLWGICLRPRLSIANQTTFTRISV